MTDINETDMSFNLELEDLPSEVLLECCKYLNAPHLFHAFDGLNRRFSELIRATELHLGFAQVTELIYEEFYTKIKRDPSIKDQVTSIDLCDARAFIESDRFLSDYVMEEFSSVKYLSLTKLKRENAKEFLVLLPSMSQLRYFNLDVDRKGWSYSSYEELFNPLVKIFIEQIKQLNIFMLPKTIENPGKTSWLLEDLSIEEITFEQCRKIFHYCPRLKRMEIGSFFAENFYVVKHPVSRRSCAMNLKNLTIKLCDDFEFLEYLFILTPNLRRLIVLMEEAEKMIDGKQWTRLISSYLPNLIDFKLRFFFRWYGEHDDIDALRLRLQGFHGDFWQIRYEMTLSSILVYSIPYPSSKYRLSSLVESYQSTSINSRNIFECVTDLSIDYSMIQSLTEYSFPNVECLALLSEYRRNAEQEQHLLSFQSIEKLTEGLSLSKLKELSIQSEYQYQSPAVFMDLLNATSNLSTLGIDLRLFRYLSSTNEQFSSLLGKKLKSLYTLGDADTRHDGSSLFDDSYSVEQFCEQYPHLERLSTEIVCPSDFLTLLRRLPKLTSIDAFMPLVDYDYSEEVADKWACELIPPLLDELHIREDQILFLYQSLIVIVQITRTIDSV